MDRGHDHNSAIGARCCNRRSTRVTKALQNSQQFGQLPKMRPKSLPSQFGQKCDIKEAGNSLLHTDATCFQIQARLTQPTFNFFVGWVVSADETKAVGPTIDSVNVRMKMRRLTSRHRPNNLRRGNAQ